MQDVLPCLRARIARETNTMKKSMKRIPMMSRLRKTSKPLTRPSQDARRPSRRAAPDARRQAAHRLQARALSASGLGAWAWNLVTNVVTCSADLEAVCGLTPGAFGGTLEAMLRVIHPDDRGAFIEAAQRTLETGGDHHAFYRIVRPDGAVRWVEAKGQVVRDRAGQVCGMTGVSMDVTARKEVETAARERESHLQALADNVPVFIARVDAGRRYLFANRAYEDHLGIPAAQVVGRTMAEVHGEAAYETVRPYVDRVLAGEAVQYDAMVPFRTVGARFIHAAYVPERGPGGEVTGFLLSAVDITARREGEEAARRLALIVENSHEAIISTDADGIALSWNQGAERLSGWTAVEVVGRPISCTASSEQEAAEITERLRGLDDAADVREYETVRVHKNGARRIVSVTFSPIHDAEKRRTGRAFIMRDVTAQREAEAAARQGASAARRLALIVENSPEAIFSVDQDGTVLSWNRGAERLYGWTAAEMVSGSINVIFPSAQEEEDVPQKVAALDQTGAAREYEAVRVRKDGTQVEVAVTFSPVHDAGGGLMARAYIVREITAQREAERERTLAERERERLADHVRLLLESSGEGIFGLDLDGRCTFFNRTAARMFGLSPAEALGQDLYALLRHCRTNGAPCPPEECPIFQSLHRGREFRVDGEVLRRADGSCFPTQLSCVPLFEGGVQHGVVVTIVDVSERRALEAEREHLLNQTEALLAEATARADRDPLTGLLNHRAFHKKLEEETERAGRDGTFLAVAMLDLDHFKFFNDAYGHPVGDDALRRVADALHQSCRPYDTPARFGGDEFAVLMPGVGRAEAEAVAARLARGLEGLSIRPPGSGEDVPLRLSVGLAVFPDEGLSRVDAVALADKRLYLAKSGGGAAGAESADAERVRGQMRGAVEGFSMLDALVTAVDNKDRYTRRHSEDVLVYSLEIARALGLDEAARQTVAAAALLHDVGKIGVPDAVLRKPGRLTDEEMETVKHHPVMGAVMVGAVPGLAETLDAIRHHHERWDGAGYPDGLRGEAIPPVARLLAVADAFSAMTSDRPYRKGMDPARARRLLEEGAGTQWDPACVAAFLQSPPGPQ